MTDARDINLNLLPTLSILLRTRSVTQTARELGLGQPAVSKQLATLRETLGDDLLVRSGSTSVLTAGARELVPLVSDALCSAQRVFHRETSIVPEEVAGTWTIGMGEETLAALGGRLVMAIRRVSKHVTVNLVAFGRTGFKALDLGQIDIALVPDIRQMAWLREEHRKVARFVVAPAFKEPWMVYSRKPDPCTLESYLSREHVLPLSLGENTTGMVDLALRAIGRERQVAASSPSLEVAMQVAASADLVLTAPATCASLLRPGLYSSLVPDEVGLGVRKMVFMWRPSDTSTPRHQILRRAIAEEVRTLG